MASDSDSLSPIPENGKAFDWTDEDREENKRLRNAGLEYISRTGRTIAAKKQADQLCNCPQKCGEKIPQEVRERLFIDFYKMGDHLKQNYFLQSYIEMRSVHKRLYQEETRVGGRLQRRVSCKYRIPLELPTSYPSENLSVTDLKRKRPKLPAGKTVEVCQKAFMNMYSITEKRIRLQRERLIIKSRYEAEERRIEAEEMKTSVSVARDLVAGIKPLLMSQTENATITSLPSQLLSSIDHDITVVNNFFRNQLWKPEYIGNGKSPLLNPSQLGLELDLE
ncbi:uncharacterized protein LOC129002067 [Macrosteles quadrilineatus]|uniref:uncharacterized protein LOC129002067 n=1 Tax=Macrosteles quadrilineatus TaxID=74068 RepID=UPI0023E275CD|nr:uncharacterized protein LOC129002067 [Macrosteles quadrilineatus]